MLGLIFALLWGSLILTFVLSVGWHAWAGLRIALGSRTRRVEDASHLGVPMPPGLQSAAAALTALGFRRLGEKHTPLKGVPGHHISWVFVDPEGTTEAEIVPLGKAALVGLTTAFADEAVVETTYPVGERINEPYFRSHVVTSSLEDAYRHHLVQVADLAAAHGIPCRIETMADSLRVEEMFRRRYVLRRSRRFIVRDVANIALSVYGLIAAAVLLLPLAREGLSAAVLIRRLDRLMGGLFPMVVVYFAGGLVLRQGSRRDATRSADAKQA
ncbi:MAG: hypothetical protein K6V36_16595 [Anaerolineae bacterium]|nr:hypothetical protein [Anaerolineae bacterium]